MVIMDTATVQKAKALGLLTLLFPVSAISAEMQVSPTVSLAGTYTDNVLAEQRNKDTSFVSSASAGLATSIQSKAFTLDMEAEIAQLYYSHDHALDKSYRTLNAQGEFSPWEYVPTLFFGASIENQANNFADNQFADLINGNTVETQNYQMGLYEEINNSQLTLSSRLSYFDRSSEDEIGESHGYTAQLSSTSGQAIKYLFWDINGSYNDRKNQNSTARNHNVELKIGFNTPFKISPYYRYYDEDFSGSISPGLGDGTTTSSGAGLRWEITKHFLFDLSYNFVDDDETLSDDYVEATIDWQPSGRTSVFAKYDQRFFGDSYELSISHKTRRLTNTITYNESLSAFERDNFETFVAGSIWCPIGQPFDQATCLPSSDGIDDLTQYLEVELQGLRPVVDNQFSLNKVLSLNSKLTLPRTTFTFDLSDRERENLSTKAIDKYFNAGLSATRKMTRRSDLTLSWDYSEVEYNSNNISTFLSQKDYYRNVSSAYTRKMSRTLAGDFTLEYRNRSSDRADRNYEEFRIALNLQKEF